MEKGMCICYWKKDDNSEKQELIFSEEDARVLEGFQIWWKEVGEDIFKEYYKIDREDEEGNLVLLDVDHYYEQQKEEEEEDDTNADDERDIDTEEYERLKEEVRRLEEELQKKKEEEEDLKKSDAFGWDDLEKLFDMAEEDYDDEDEDDDDDYDF